MDRAVYVLIINMCMELNHSPYNEKGEKRDQRRLRSVIELSTQFGPLPLGHKYIEADYEVSKGVGINKISRTNSPKKKRKI